MSVPADEHVDAEDFGSELRILGKAEVRQHHDQVASIFVAQAFDVHRQFGIAEGEADPCGIAWRHALVDNVRRDPDDSDAKAAALDDAAGCEHQTVGAVFIAVDREHGIGQSLGKIAEALRPVGELPVRSHRVELECIHQRNLVKDVAMRLHLDCATERARAGVDESPAGG